MEHDARHCEAGDLLYHPLREHCSVKVRSVKLNQLQRSAVLYAEGQETCSTTCSERIAQRASGALSDMRSLGNIAILAPPSLSREEGVRRNKQQLLNCPERIAQRVPGAHCSTDYEEALSSKSRLETCSTALPERHAQRDYQEHDAQLASSGAKCSTLQGRRPALWTTQSVLLG